MTDLVRIVVIVGVLAVAGLAAYVTRKTAPLHLPVYIEGLGLPSGVIVFTSTECPRCREVLDVIKRFDVPLREVTYEVEAELQERAGVTGVPLTLVIDRSGGLVAQIAGRLRSRQLRRALSRAGY